VNGPGTAAENTSSAAVQDLQNYLGARGCQTLTRRSMLGTINVIKRRLRRPAIKTR
jgi:hypothetical protein